MVGIVGIYVEGPLPPGINGGIVRTNLAIMGPPLVGSRPTTMCAVGNGPLRLELVGLVEGIPVMMEEQTQAHYQPFPLGMG